MLAYTVWAIYSQYMHEKTKKQKQKNMHVVHMHMQSDGKGKGDMQSDGNGKGGMQSDGNGKAAEAGKHAWFTTVILLQINMQNKKPYTTHTTQNVHALASRPQHPIGEVEPCS